MSEELLVTRVRSQTVGIPGRSLATARQHHFVIDEPAYAGGPGEALTPAEVFLAGVSGCGVLLVESFARKDGIPLQKAEASIEGIRTADDPANFREVRLSFRLTGVTAQQGETLVEKFKAR
jgi:uncharacterized OsmC-like protein